MGCGAPLPEARRRQSEGFPLPSCTSIPSKSSRGPPARPDWVGTAPSTQVPTAQCPPASSAESGPNRSERLENQGSLDGQLTSRGSTYRACGAGAQRAGGTPRGEGWPLRLHRWPFRLQGGVPWQCGKEQRAVGQLRGGRMVGSQCEVGDSVESGRTAAWRGWKWRLGDRSWCLLQQLSSAGALGPRALGTMSGGLPRCHNLGVPFTSSG